MWRAPQQDRRKLSAWSLLQLAVFKSTKMRHRSDTMINYSMPTLTEKESCSRECISFVSLRGKRLHDSDYDHRRRRGGVAVAARRRVTSSCDSSILSVLLDLVKFYSKSPPWKLAFGLPDNNLRWMSEFFCPARDSTRKSDSTANYYPAIEVTAALEMLHF